MEENNSRSARNGKPSVWKSKSLLVAVAILVAGLATWGYSLATRPATVGASATGSPAVGGLIDSPGVSSEGAAPMRLVDKLGPAVSRFGASFIGGFALGFAGRKFLKFTLMLAALAAAGLYGLHHFGIIDLSVSDIQKSVNEGVEYAKSNADKAKSFLTGYIPSATAGGIGAFMGFRKG